MSSVHPAVQAAMSKKEKAIKWSLVIAVAAVLALLMLVILVATAGIGVLPLAILLAFFPLPLYLAYALWIDRYEPEPRWLLLVIFLWGALVAVTIAFILGLIGEWIVGESLGKGGVAVGREVA